MVLVPHAATHEQSTQPQLTTITNPRIQYYPALNEVTGKKGTMALPVAMILFLVLVVCGYHLQLNE